MDREVLRPVIYVMGPFRAKTEWERATNIFWAKNRGVEVALMGGAPLVPHAAVAYYHDSMPEAEQMNVCFSLLARSHGAITTQGWGGSDGTRQEIEFCQRREIPVFHNLTDLSAFMKEFHGHATR